MDATLLGLYTALLMTLFWQSAICDNRTGCVDKEFIKELEGFRTEGYVPKYSNGTVIGQSGVTIGNGIDLGTKNRKYFEDLGVADSVIDKLEPYFGLKKQAAVDKLEEMPLTLTEAEATELSNKVMDKNIADVKAKYNNAISSDKKTWDELTDAQRTVIASVLFQYGSPSRTPKFWGHCVAQDWDAVEAELRNFGDDYPTRRRKEADYLQDDDGSNCGQNDSGDDCGLCDLSYSPQKACTSVGTKICSVRYYTNCGWWGRRCARYRYSQCRGTINTCCRGSLSGDNCQVDGCGGQKDEDVKNQPACYQQVSKVKSQVSSYTANCGWWWRRCTKYRTTYVVYYERGSPYCAAGFSLSGDRCIKL